MKKKLIIKESELKEFVKNFLNEEQLELDFPVEKDTLTEMLEMKYQEIVEEIKNSIDDVDSLEEIYDNKIFNLIKNLHKVNSDIATKFSELEDTLVSYIEIKKEHVNLSEDLNDSLNDLMDLIK